MNRPGRLRVLAVLPGLEPSGGTEQSFMATASDLIASGIDLHVAVLSERLELVPAAERLGVVVHDLSTVRPTVVGRARAIGSLCRAIRPDLLHASLHDATLPSQLVAAALRVPILVSWVNVTYGPSRRGESGVSDVRLEVLRWEEAVLGRLSRSWYQAVTPEVGRLTAAAVHAPTDRVLLGERGRDPGRFPFRSGRGAPPVDLGLPDGARLVVAVGRQEPQKGYERLLEAFDRLAAARPEVHLVVAGRPGGATPELRELQARLPTRERIHLVGHREDVTQLLVAADVIACTSRREGAAGALIEAMAVGVPIVALPVAGLEGVVVNEENALVVGLADLPTAMARVLDSPDLAHRLALSGRRWFETRFTTAAASARLAEIYRAVAASAGGRTPDERLLVSG